MNVSLIYRRTAYFDKCYDRIFGIVHRSTFEARLRHHFSSAKQPQHPEEDVAWYALRNIIYAAGCRCALAECNTVSFVEAQAEAFRFFQNALSVYVELTFTYTGLTAVRVLILMVSALPSSLWSMCSLCSGRVSMRRASVVQPSTIPSARTLHKLHSLKACTGSLQHRLGLLMQR